MASGETREARLEGIKLAMNAVAYYRDTRSNITDTGCVQKSAAWAIYRRLESLYEDWSRFEPAPLPDELVLPMDEFLNVAAMLRIPSMKIAIATEMARYYGRGVVRGMKHSEAALALAREALVDALREMLKHLDRIDCPREDFYRELPEHVKLIRELLRERKG